MKYVPSTAEMVVATNKMMRKDDKQTAELVIGKVDLVPSCFLNAREYNCNCRHNNYVQASDKKFDVDLPDAPSLATCTDTVKEITLNEIQDQLPYQKVDI